MNMQASLLIYELRARFGVNVAVFFLRSQVNKGAVWIAELSLDPYLLLITLINYNFGPKENFFCFVLQLSFARVISEHAFFGFRLWISGDLLSSIHTTLVNNQLWQLEPL